jgi:cytochrome P450
MQPTPSRCAADAAQLSIRAYFLALIAEKRRRPADDLLSKLANVEVDGDRLTDDELVTLATLLFAAGFETTTNLFGNGLLALLRQPEQIALLRRDASLFANLPDELLRYDGGAAGGRVTEPASRWASIPPADRLHPARLRQSASTPDPDRSTSRAPTSIP